MSHPVSRRLFWPQSVGAAALLSGNSSYAFPEEAKQIAAIVTVYTKDSHADGYVGKVLEGWQQDGAKGPDLKLMSLYADQVPKNDLSLALAKKHDVLHTRNIEQALTLGTGKFAVEGVLSMGEHGDYPRNKLGQFLYPRKRFFDEIVKVMRRHRRFVPLFNDKHLSWSWDESQEMVETAHELGIPFMAGSSIPVTWRKPVLVLPRGCQIEEAIGLGYADLEAYGIHTLEGLQCMVERRQGGETGVRSVQALQGEAMWKAAREGRWSTDLLEAALKVVPHKKGDVKTNVGNQGAVFLVEYRDGTRGSVAMLNGHIGQFGFAAKLRGVADPVACWFVLQEEHPWEHHANLLRAVEQMFHSGKPSYPVERTLLTSGIQQVVMQSLADGGRRIATPHLAVKYTPSDYPLPTTKPFAAPT